MEYLEYLGAGTVTYFHWGIPPNIIFPTPDIKSL
jgi:hypothetical protein